MNKNIYFDNAATTATDERVIEEMLVYMKELYGNPSGKYSFAARARSAVQKARETVAGLIGADADEIYFTSGGTESDNLAIRGICGRRVPGKNRIICGSTEHKAILNTASAMKEYGFELQLLPTDRDGIITGSQLELPKDERTLLVSVMNVNNETGAVNDIPALAQAAHSIGAYFHTDAVQAVGHIPVDVHKAEIDMLSASAHKLHGPKGIGMLYVRRGLKPLPVITGGGQEKDMRSGTENVPGIVGFAAAARIAAEEMNDAYARASEIKRFMTDEIMSSIPDVRINGSTDDRFSPYILSVSFKNVEASSLIIKLDTKGICCSAGSACTSSDSEPSHVLKAIGVPAEYLRGTLRFSFSKYSTKEEAELCIKALKDAVSSLRSITEEI